QPAQSMGWLVRGNVVGVRYGEESGSPTESSQRATALSQPKSRDAPGTQSWLPARRRERARGFSLPEGEGGGRPKQIFGRRQQDTASPRRLHSEVLTAVPSQQRHR